MTARKITRRRVVAGAAAAVALGAVPAAGRPRFRGGKGRPTPPPPSDGMSRTVINTAASATPSNWGTIVMMEFARGDVPAGYIAEPTVGGVVQNYNIDLLSVQHGDDGSQSLGAYFITRNSSLGAGQSIQFIMQKRLGSYQNTSSIDENDFVSETDFKWRVSKVHTAKTTQTTGQMFTPTIDPVTGRVTGAKVFFPSNMTTPTKNVTGAGGVGGQLSIAGGVVTVVAPGSGYGYVGAGTFTAAFNTIISSVASGGNYANGVSWHWVARGNACDVIEGTIVLHSTFANYHVEFQIYRWKKPDGTLLDYMFIIRAVNGVVSGVEWTNYTYDIDVMNGATVIRGAATGYEPHISHVHYAGIGLMSMNETALPDWLSGAGAASNAIIPYLTPAECLYQRSAGIISPWNENETSLTTPTVQNYWDNSSGSNGVNWVGRYRPGGTFGMRHGGQNGPGSFNIEQAFDEVTQRFWLACYHQNLAAAKVYHNNMLVQAAHAANSASTGGAKIIEPTTTLLPNIIPATDQTFGIMLPTRQNFWAGGPQMTASGGSHPILYNGAGPLGWLNDTSHGYGVSLGPYLFTGHDWMRNNVIYGGTAPVHAASNGGRRAIFGGRTYWGVRTSTDIPTNVRIEAWYRMRLLQALMVLPEGDIQKAYINRIAEDNLDYSLDLPGYTGTLTDGITVRTKDIDFSDSGILPQQYYPGSTELLVRFMDEYEHQYLSSFSWIFQGTPLGIKLRAHRDYRNVYVLGLHGGSGPAFYADAYRMRARDGIDGGGVDFNVGINPSNPGFAIRPSAAPGGGQATRYFTTVDGSDILTLSGPIVLFGTTELGNGARAFVTSTDTGLTGGGHPVPTGFSEDIAYWYQRIDSTHFRLCLDAAFTLPVTAGETLDDPNDQYNRGNFWMVPQAWPAIDAGYGTTGNGTSLNPSARIGSMRGILHMAKAYALPGDDTTKLDIAISRLDAAWASIGGGLYSAAVSGGPWIPTSYSTTR